MKYRISAAALLLATASAAPALAQKLDAPVVEPTPVAVQTAPVYSWAGGYAGAQLGYTYADTDTSDLDEEDRDTLDYFTEPGETFEDARDAINAIGEDGGGVSGGIHTGYLWQNNNFVYGGEASYDWMDLEVDNELGDINSQAALKAKAGYSFGRTLLYGTGGAVYGDADLVGESFNDWGWAVGAGVDYFVTEQVSLGAEVLYSDYAEFDDSNVDVSLTNITAKLAYHF